MTFIGFGVLSDDFILEHFAKVRDFLCSSHGKNALAIDHDGNLRHASKFGDLQGDSFETINYSICFNYILTSDRWFIAIIVVSFSSRVAEQINENLSVSVLYVLNGQKIKASLSSGLPLFFAALMLTDSDK